MPESRDTRASFLGQRSTPTRFPGMWQATTAAALSALAFGFWGRPGAGPSDAAATAMVSRVAEVAPQDLVEALSTMAWSPEQLAQFRGREACSRRLAWVTVAGSPGQPPGRLRLGSGAYLSPAFDLTDAPVRVALPYPAPYPTGHGTVLVLGTTTDAIVALLPPWHVPAQGGPHARAVIWVPAGGCPGASK